MATLSFRDRFQRLALRMGTYDMTKAELVTLDEIKQGYNYLGLANLSTALIFLKTFINGFPFIPAHRLNLFRFSLFGTMLPVSYFTETVYLSPKWESLLGNINPELLDHLQSPPTSPPNDGIERKQSPDAKK